MQSKRSSLNSPSLEVGFAATAGRISQVHNASAAQAAHADNIVLTRQNDGFRCEHLGQLNSYVSYYQQTR